MYSLLRLHNRNLGVILSVAIFLASMLIWAPLSPLMSTFVFCFNPCKVTWSYSQMRQFLIGYLIFKLVDVPAGIYLPMASFWCLYCLLWTCFTPFSSVSSVNFEHVIAGMPLPTWNYTNFSYIINYQFLSQFSGDGVIRVFNQASLVLMCCL